MSAARTRLTRKLIEETCAVGRDTWLWDRDVAGFGVKITPAGRRTYVLQYRIAGRSRRYSIGRHGSPWTVETARERARLLLGKVAGGVDPQEEKQGARREITVAELGRLYITEGLVTRKPASIASARSNFEHHINPILGAKKASQVTRADVERLLIAVAEGATRTRFKGAKRRETIVVKGGKGAATAAVLTLSAAYSFAVRRSLTPDNPAWGVRKFPGKKLERFLAPAELARLGEVIAAAEALGIQSPYALAALKVLILTGCRLQEILTLKRAYIDRDHRLLRLPDSKTGAKVIHVGSRVLAIIEALPQVEGNPYVFVGRGGVGRLVYLQSTWERIRKAAGLEDVRLHDLRHSFASMGAASGDSLMVIGALLGHKTSKSTERYAHMADRPVRSAAERISFEIARLMGQAEEASPEPAGAGAGLVEAPDEMSLLLGRVARTRWIDTREAAARTGLSVDTLANYRYLGMGPPYRNLHNRIVYPEPELTAWIGARAEGEAATGGGSG
jgi:integrase